MSRSSRTPGGFRGWIREIHRRSIWQVLSVYLVGSWGALQVVESITENAGLPDWVPPFALVLLIIGLPIVLATAVVQDGLPGEEPPPEPEAAARSAANLAAGTGALDLPSTRGSFLERNLTWKRAILGGAFAFALLTVAVGGYFAMRAMGVGPVASLVAQGVLDERDPVVLAEFGNTTGDEALGELVTEALRVDLLSSPVLTVVEPAYVDQVLARMERDPSESLTGDVAREVAIREGFKAVIEGEVGSVGSGYLVNGRIVSAADGSILAAFRRTATDEAGLIEAIDGLSQDIREKSGESLRSIKSGEALGTVTTSSLDALRLYTRAVRTAEQGDPERGIALMEEALAADSTFAMAWRKYAALLGNVARPSEDIDSAATRAWRLRDRLTDRERYTTLGYYHAQVTGDLDEAERAYRNVLEMHPDDRTALNNLSLIYSDRGEHERALELLERAVDGPGETNLAHYNRVIALMALGRFDDALAAADRYAERYPDDPRVDDARADVYYRAGRIDEGRALAERGVESAPSPRVRGVRLHRLAELAVMGGRLEDAEGYFRRVAEADSFQVTHALTDLMRMEVDVRRDLDAAAAWPERGARERPFRPHFEGFDPVFALFVRARLARPGAEEELERFFADPPEAIPANQLLITEARARAFLALGAEDWEAAVEHLRETRRLEDCEDCLLFDEGYALARAGRTEEAVEALEGWLETDDTSIERALFDPAALELLGGLHEERGDTAAALEAWSRFAELWADADPELQPRVRHARERIAALGGSGGGSGDGGGGP